MINDDNVFAFLGIAIGVSIAALFYARYLYGSVKKEKIHMHLLENLSSFIHEGAMAFLSREYKIIILFIIVVAVLLASLGLIPSLQHADGVGDGSGTGSGRQSRHAAFQGCDALLKNVLGGVGQAAIDVAGVCQAKTGLGVVAVMEYIRSGLINRYGSGVGSGIRLLLANMQLQSLKCVFLAHNSNSFQVQMIKCRLRLGHIHRLIRPNRKFCLNKVGNNRFIAVS